MKVLGVIPARYKSSRFEGKPLCLINGVTMIERTYNRALKSRFLNDLLVATDSETIEKFCHSKNIPVLLTSSYCLTGTDRLAEVAQKLNADLYINIQGDEPVIDYRSIDEIVGEFKKFGDIYSIFNLYKIIDSEEANRETIIKVIVNEKDELLYMSRAVIPFDKNHNAAIYKKQVCVYGFTKEVLEVFAKRDKTLNELYEDIEILRFIDMGYRVKMKETKFSSISVDVPSDVAKVEAFLKANNLN